MQLLHCVTRSAAQEIKSKLKIYMNEFLFGFYKPACLNTMYYHNENIKHRQKPCITIVQGIVRYSGYKNFSQLSTTSRWILDRNFYNHLPNNAQNKDNARFFAMFFVFIVIVHCIQACRFIK